MQHTYHCLLGVNLPETAYVQSSSPLGLSRTKVEFYLATILVFWMAQQNHPQCSHVQHRCMHVLSDRLSFACQCCTALQNEVCCAVLCCAVLCCAVLCCFASTECSTALHLLQYATCAVCLAQKTEKHQACCCLPVLPFQKQHCPELLLKSGFCLCLLCQDCLLQC